MSRAPRPRVLPACLVVASLLAAGLGALTTAAATDEGAAPAEPEVFRVSAMGDIGWTDESAANVQRALDADAQGLLGLGDYDYDGTVESWLANMEPLLSRGAWLARGNHEPRSTLPTFAPYMPGGAPSWAILLGGAHVIAIDTETNMTPGTPQHEWFVREVSRMAPETLKIVVMHKPWWLDRDYFKGDPEGMDALVDLHGVDLVLAGHAHTYQRSERADATYVVAGTGGESKSYPRPLRSGTLVTGCRCYGQLLLDLSPERVAATFLGTDGIARDSFVVGAPLPPAPPDPPLLVSAMGDIGSTAASAANLARATEAGAQGLVGLGDYLGPGDDMASWAAAMDPLVSQGAWFARGNKDDALALAPYTPDGDTRWSILLGGVRVVAIDTQRNISPGTDQHRWLEDALAQEPPEAPKVLVMHRPWWIQGQSFKGDAADMDRLVRVHGVDLVLAAHLTFYERVEREGAQFALVGTGGLRLQDPVPPTSGTVASACRCHGQLLLELSSAGIDARFVDIDGATRDAFGAGA